MLSTVYDQLHRMENLYSDRTAFQYYDEDVRRIIQITYAQYICDIRKIGWHLHQIIPDIKGKHIAFLAKNSYRYITYMMAAIACGAVIIPLNHEKTTDEISYEINHSDSRILLYDHSLPNRFQGFLEELSLPQFLMEMDNSWQLSTFEEDDAERMAVIMYTSGTTEKSKGVMMCQRGLYTSVSYVIAAFDQMHLEAPHYFFILPLYHISGIMGILSNGSIGATVNICQDIMYLYRDLKLMNSSTTSVSPIVVNSWYKDLKHGRKARLGGLQTVFCGGASLNADLISTFTENGILISQGYGMTEVGGISGNTLTDLSKLDSIGTPTVGSQVQIIDGEICVKSKSIMIGYYKDPDATNRTIIGGWLHTGDLGYQDNEGYIYITGRKKNLIILDSGENVQPEILEKRILSLPGVREVLVSEKSGKICATIVCDPKDQEEITKQVKLVNKDYPIYHRVTIIDFAENELNKTSIGKIKRNTTNE